MELNIDNELLNYSGVYIIKNTIDKRTYIGSTNCFRTRYNSHKRALNNNKHTNKHLQCFVNKYGINKLSFNILCFCSISVLLHNEKLLIDEIKPAFNMKPIEMKGFIVYDVAKQKKKAMKLLDEVMG